MCITRNHRRQRGLTLIELVMFMVIVGVAAAGIMGVLNIAGKHSADPARRKQALLIAEALMEEVQLARFTFCDPTDPAASTATTVADCATPVTVSVKSGLVRPYANVADYATQLGQDQPSFASGGIDRDVNGRPLGQIGTGASAVSAITSTVALNVLDTANALNGITSTAADLRVLRITIKTVYGTGPNDVIQLDGYRSRYAPTYVP
jgi:MSHA pilin protein MshD